MQSSVETGGERAESFAYASSGRMREPESAAERLFVRAKRTVSKRFKEVRRRTADNDNVLTLLDSRVFPTRDVWYQGTWRYLPGETRRKIVVTADCLCIGYEGGETMIEEIPLHDIRDITTPCVHGDTMHELFHAWDADQDGQLTLLELQDGFQKYGLTAEDTREMFFPMASSPGEHLCVDERTFENYRDRIDELARRVVVIRMEDNEGLHSGMTYQLGFLGEHARERKRLDGQGDGFMEMEEWVTKLKCAVELAKHRTSIFTARKQFQARLSQIYHRNAFQWTMALLIVLNFVLSATQVPLVQQTGRKRPYALRGNSAISLAIGSRLRSRNRMFGVLWPRSWIAQGMSIVAAGFLLSDHRWHHHVVRTQLQIHPEPGSTMHRLCEDGDIVFTIIFTLEVLFNMTAHWFTAFWSDGWNVFDFVIVVVCLATIQPDGLGGTYNNLRLVRAFKVLRILKRLVELRMLVNALTASLWPLANAFVIVVIFVNIYAVLGVSFYQDTDPENFRTFSKAIFTILQVTTLDNWSQIAKSDPYVEADGNLSNASTTFFLSLVFVISFTLLPVVVAVLLDNFTLATRKEKDKIKMEALERSDRTSGSCKRSLSLDPLICRLIAASNQEELSKLLQTIFRALDLDQSGWLNYGALRDGLLIMKAFSPPIRLTEQEFDAITEHKALCNSNQEIDAHMWELIMRRQMALFAHRQLAVSIPAVMADDQHLGILLFATRIILERSINVEADTLQHQELSEPYKETSGLSSTGGPGRDFAEAPQRASMENQAGATAPAHRAAEIYKRGLNKGSLRHMARNHEEVRGMSPGSQGLPQRSVAGATGADLSQRVIDSDRVCGALDRMSESIRQNTHALAALEVRVAEVERRVVGADGAAGSEAQNLEDQQQMMAILRQSSLSRDMCASPPGHERAGAMHSQEVPIDQGTPDVVGDASEAAGQLCGSFARRASNSSCDITEGSPRAVTVGQPDVSTASGRELERVCEGWLWMKAPAGSRLLRSCKYKSRWLVLLTGRSEAVLKCYICPEDAGVAGKELNAMPISGMQVEPEITLQGALFKNFFFFAIHGAAVQDSAGYAGRVELGANTPDDRVRWVEALIRYGAVSKPTSLSQKRLVIFKDPKTPKGSIFAITLGLFDPQNKDEAVMQDGYSKESLGGAEKESDRPEVPSQTTAKPNHLTPIDIQATVSNPETLKRASPSGSARWDRGRNREQAEEEVGGRANGASAQVALKEGKWNGAENLHGTVDEAVVVSANTCRQLAASPREGEEKGSDGEHAQSVGVFDRDHQRREIPRAATFTGLTLETSPREHAATFTGLMLSGAR